MICLKNKGISIGLLLISVLVSIHSCKHEENLLQTEIETGNISNITDSSAIMISYINSMGDNLIEYGHCWSTHPEADIGDYKCISTNLTSQGSFRSQLTDLTGNTKYYVRSYANDNGYLIFGEEISFTTDDSPFINPNSPNYTDHWMAGETHSINWTDNIVENVNIVLLNDGTPVLTIAADIPDIGEYSWKLPDNCVYGAEYQVRISSTSRPEVIGLSPAFKISEINGTQSNTIYLDYNYKTIKIGTQWWMAENLRATEFNNGSIIPLIVDNSSWSNATSSAYCNYTTNADISTYGNLYNWYTVNTEQICPEGWHVPSDVEWSTLISFLGGDAIAGGKMKETGTIHWTTPNSGATNESGFTALPGGYRLPSITQIGNYACWWSSTGFDGTTAKVYSTNYNNTFLNVNSNPKSSGASIRCIRN